jgi:hypothetical protein
MPIFNELLSSGYTLRSDPDAGGKVLYLGWAVPGTLASAAGWAIRKFTYDSNGNNTLIEWADGNQLLDNIWDNRAALTYA